MPNVFAINKTSSSITVAGHKTYYIDSADAEIVEVEGQVGAISNTAAIYIRGYKCGYDITLTQSGYENFSGVLACELKGVIYTNYQQTTTQACNYSGNVTFTNGSGTVEVAPFSWTYYGDNITQHDCTDNTSVKYNAFKYTLSGTPYYYVIDGEHNTWTDDLSAWGYSEVPVGPVLPEVKQVKASGNGWGYLVSNLSDTSVSIANNEKASLYFTANTNAWGSSSLPYSVGMLQSPSGTDIGTQGVIIDTSENVVKCKNVSGSSLSITRMTVYYCNDATATVVTVYDSSNVAYNAFKFTANNTDYYYVLDGTQTDWTDDLAGIGYSLTPNYLKGYMNSSKTDAYVSRYSEKNLYDGTGNFIIGDSSKTYTIIGVYTANGGSVSYQSARLYAYENKLRFVWNDYDAYMAYIEYTVSDGGG